ncbi:MAG TPA: type 4a pilus biogenesis protein PilO [Phycisphaerae bacterium]|jgi:Tfp pilus assembly protein PilO
MANKAGNNRPHAHFLFSGYAILAMGFALGVVMPHVRTANAVEAEIKKYGQEISTRLGKQTELVQVQNRVKLIELETKDYPRLVAPSQDAFPFLSLVVQQLNEANMHDASYHNLAPVSLNRSEKLPFEVRAKGTYAQFRDFLERLEKLDRLSSVGRVTIDSESDMSGNVDVQVTLYIYSAKQPTATP